jgi:hypothetical protein
MHALCSERELEPVEAANATFWSSRMRPHWFPTAAWLFVGIVERCPLRECVEETDVRARKHRSPSMHNVPIREENASRADDLPHSE